MKNLVEQASTWLRSEECNKGSILERTAAVEMKYREYLKDEKDEICSNTELSYPLILSNIELLEKSINKIQTNFLHGKQQEALQETYKMMGSMKFDMLFQGTPLYKCRENERLYHYSNDEMFHIPYEKRHLVRNQRFSLSGIPCLYLGGSSYICWEELGRKDFNTSNYCGYSLKEPVDMFDMMLPTAIINEHQLRKVLLILVCSQTANREHIFKPEYILPQCVLHSLIQRTYDNHKPICVRYYSSHFLKGDADYFEHDYEEKTLQRYVNYVFPAASTQDNGYSNELRKVFNQTETISPMRENLRNPSNFIDSFSEDPYVNSHFGLIDSILDEKLGFKSKRTKITFVVDGS